MGETFCVIYSVTLSQSWWFCKCCEREMTCITLQNLVKICSVARYYVWQAVGWINQRWATILIHITSEERKWTDASDKRTLHFCGKSKIIERAAISRKSLTPIKTKDFFYWHALNHYILLTGIIGLETLFAVLLSCPSSMSVCWPPEAFCLWDDTRVMCTRKVLFSNSVRVFDFRQHLVRPWWKWMVNRP